MNTSAKYKICRRLGAGVYEKCQTNKFVQSEARKAKSAKRKKAPTDYGAQLIEKQKVRYSYGISERQLSNYVAKATHAKGMPVTDKLFEELETRLDNVIYRLGFAHTRAFARQLVTHGHFTVNGRRTDIPSRAVKIGDKIGVREGSKKSPVFADFEKKVNGYNWPKWLKLTPSALEAEVIARPKNEEQFLNFETVLEFYSR
jgi:small subunit ribosomal protein S4